MEYQKPDEWLNSGLKILRDHYKDYDFKRFRPFYHGTSNFHYEDIKKEGLCPRGERSSVWVTSIADLSSPKDRVYFAQCRDWIPNSASQKAVDIAGKMIREAEWRPDESYESRWGVKKKDFQEEPKKLFLRLDNFEKYAKYVERDTDKLYMDEIIEDKYSMNPLHRQPIELNKHIPDAINYTALCNTYIEKKVIDVLDVLWIKCGWDCVKKAIQTIPSAVRSLYSLPFSISMHKCIIDPDDLTPLTIDEWYADKKGCPQLAVDGGCDREETELKRIYANNLRNWKWRDKVDKPRWMEDAVIKAKKQLPIEKEKVFNYINEVKVPRFLNYINKIS